MISWTQLWLGGLVVLCSYSLFFYFSSTQPLLAKVRKLEAGLLAIANELARAQRNLQAQALSSAEKVDRIVRLRQRTRENPKKHLGSYPGRLHGLASRAHAPAPQRIEPAEKSAAAEPAIPDPIAEGPPTLRLTAWESTRLAAAEKSAAAEPAIPEPIAGGPPALRLAARDSARLPATSKRPTEIHRVRPQSPPGPQTPWAPVIAITTAPPDPQTGPASRRGAVLPLRPNTEDPWAPLLPKPPTPEEP